MGKAQQVSNLTVEFLVRVRVDVSERQRVCVCVCVYVLSPAWVCFWDKEAGAKQMVYTGVSSMYVPYVCMNACMCVCVCVCEGESEREGKRRKRGLKEGSWGQVQATSFCL